MAINKEGSKPAFPAESVNDTGFHVPQLRFLFLTIGNLNPGNRMKNGLRGFYVIKTSILGHHANSLHINVPTRQQFQTMTNK